MVFIRQINQQSLIRSPGGSRKIDYCITIPAHVSGGCKEGNTCTVVCAVPIDAESCATIYMDKQVITRKCTIRIALKFAGGYQEIGIKGDDVGIAINGNASIETMVTRRKDDGSVRNV